MKQTAVDWLIEQYNNGEFVRDLKQKALEMEKQQIIKFVDDFAHNTEFFSPEEYYNSTFNKL
jgi:hypothetical protein